MAEGKRSLLSQEHTVDGLEDDLLHRWEIEILHSELGTVLDVNPQVNLLFVIVLHSNDQTEVDTECLAILLKHMDQVIQHSVVE